MVEARGYSMKISIENFTTCLLVLLFIISAVNRLTTIVGVLLFALAAILILNSRSYANGIYIPKLIVYMLLFQNFSIGIGARLTGNADETLSLLTQIPTLVISLSYIHVFFKTRANKLSLVFYVYLLLCIIQALQTNATYTVKLTYLRNFTIFFLSYEVGRYYINTSEKLNSFIVFFLRLAVVAGLYGLVGMWWGESFYQAMGVSEVGVAKQAFTFRHSVPGTFRTLVLGVWVNRLVSFYYEPVNFSYFISLASLLSFVAKYKASWFVLLCNILTFGKGGLLVLMLSVFCLYIHRLFHKFSKKIIRKLIIVGSIIGVILLVLFIDIFFGNDFGTANHYYGIITGFQGVVKNPLGHGIGSAGNLLKTLENAKTHAGMAISETGLINMMYQIGIIPALLFIAILISMMKKAFVNYKTDRGQVWLLFSYMPMILLIASVFQENTLSPQCIVPFMLFQGAANNVKKRESI